MGVTGLGTAVKYIPRPVVIGFTNGIAVLIASTQVKDFFGLHLDKVPGVFWQRVEALARDFHTLSFEATALAVFTLLVLIICRSLSARIPGPIVALLLSTSAVYFFKLPVETIGTKFGGIPAGLPHMHIPHFRSDLIYGLLGPAFTVAMLGAIESLMSAVVSDRMSNDRHNPNVELIGQGVANIFSPMFGGLPATGAIARTATNIRSGAQSPVAGIIHALTLLCILLFAAPLVSYVPMAALAGILMVVAYNMGEWREIPQLLKLTKTDISIWLVTFALTVFADLTVAVEAGMILAALLFISRVASTTTVSQVTDDYVEDGRVHILQDKDIPYYATIFRIHGPFLFGATDKIQAVTENVHKLASGGHLASTEYDRARRHWIVRHRRGCQGTACQQAHVDSVRGAGATGATHSPGRVRRGHRPGEHLRQCAGSLATGRGSVRGARGEVCGKQELDGAGLSGIVRLRPQIVMSGDGATMRRPRQEASLRSVRCDNRNK